MTKSFKKPGELFAGKNEVSRKELKEALKEDSGIIPGLVGEKYRKSERTSLLEVVFPLKKYGSNIKKWQMEKATRELQSRQFKAKSQEQRQDLEKKVRYLKKITGA